jgi:hypothetical protein
MPYSSLRDFMDRLETAGRPVPGSRSSVASPRNDRDLVDGTP